MRAAVSLWPWQEHWFGAVLEPGRVFIGFHALDSMAALVVAMMVVRMGFEVASGDHH